ncbi:hypothetical protein ABZ354_19370 [Streptomyces sp. NPDC005925]|uniref:hypothetical protein n=1 Tax=Streptomyces sp. NPDC005925 TaxID=3157172 RepID=UPI0033C9BCB9
MDFEQQLRIVDPGQHRLHRVVQRLASGRLGLRPQPVHPDLAVHDVDSRVAGQVLGDVPVHLVQQHLQLPQVLVRATGELPLPFDQLRAPCGVRVFIAALGQQLAERSAE